VRKIAEFLGRPLTEEQTATIVKRTRFDAMKKDPDVNFKQDSFVKVETKSLFFRKGMYFQLLPVFATYISLYSIIGQLSLESALVAKSSTRLGWVKAGMLPLPDGR